MSQACLQPDLETEARAGKLLLLDQGMVALHKPLLLLKADLCLNPARFQSWERLASAGSLDEQMPCAHTGVCADAWVLCLLRAQLGSQA